MDDNPRPAPYRGTRVGRDEVTLAVEGDGFEPPASLPTETTLAVSDTPRASASELEDLVERALP